MAFKPLAGLTRLLRILLIISIGLDVLSVPADVFDYYSYSNLPSDVDPNETLLPSDVVTVLLGLIQLIFFLVLGITFLRWIYRVNQDLRVWAADEMEFTPGWAVGWYFIPIANLFKPYQSMREIWRISHRREGSHGTVQAWWTLWITSNFLGRLAWKLNLRANDAEDYATSALGYIASDVFDVALGIVAFVLVGRIGAAYARNSVEARPATS